MQHKYTVLFTELWDAGQALTTTFRCGAHARGVLTWTFLGELRHYDEEIAVMAEAAISGPQEMKCADSKLRRPSESVQSEESPCR